MASLTIWTICDGEPLPIDDGAPRPMRTAILSKLLADQGHEVVYWTSRFDHIRKGLRMDAPAHVDSGQGFRIVCVDALPYTSNVSWARLKHNRVVAQDMQAQMRSDPKRPNIIVADLPTLELAELAGRLGQEWQVPVILSIRDLWPDVFSTLLPRPLQGLGSLVFAPWQARAKRACRMATSIVGISPGYLDWGLARAGRARSVNDALIPLGYPARHPEDADRTAQAKSSLETRGVDFSRPLISFIGTFGRSYDLDTVISAAKILSPDSDAQFVLCGDGERAAAWKAHAKDLPNVVFSGWVDQVEISTLLDASTLGLAAYARGVKQGLPNKFFEYMSFGLPVISALGGEASQEINTYGFGCNYQAGNGADLAQVLKTVLGDPQGLAQMGNAALNRFESTYHQSVVYQHYIDLVERLAGKATMGKNDPRRLNETRLQVGIKEAQDV